MSSRSDDGAPPGWYPDPLGPGLRWWDGWRWTEHQAVRADRRSDGPAPPDRPGYDAEPVPLGIALVASVGAVVVLNVMAWMLLDTSLLERAPTVIRVLVALAIEPVCMLIPLVVWASRHDVALAPRVGLRITPDDIPRGLLMGLVARLAPMPVVALLGLISTRLLGTNTGGVREARDDPWQVVYIVLAAVVIAPIVEEIAFRGALLPALTARFGATPGLVVNSALFGLAHASIAAGWGNVGLTASLAVVGAVLAYEARQRGRLGSAIIAHATANGVAVLFVLLL